MQMNANSNMCGGGNQVALSRLHIALIIIRSIITRLYCAQVLEASAGPRCKQQQEQREQQTFVAQTCAKKTRWSAGLSRRRQAGIKTTGATIAAGLQLIGGTLTNSSIIRQRRFAPLLFRLM